MSGRRWPQFGKFISVGALNTLLGLAVIYAVKWFFQLGDAAANAIGYAVGLAASFALNSRWTFAYRGAQLPALARFLAVALLAYAVNLLVVLASIRYLGLNGYVAQALGVPPYTLTTYFASRAFVFRTGARSDA